MQCSVMIVVEIAPEGDISQMESAIEEAGRRAMRTALGQAVQGYEATHLACPRCGCPQSQGQGTMVRRVLTRFGRVVVPLRRQRCGACGKRFRPARGCLGVLGRGNVTPALGTACALAGASWPYATAARVLRELCGAQISHEAVRAWTKRLGAQEADMQRAEAEHLLTPTAEQVRAERDDQLQRERVGASTSTSGALTPPAAPRRLIVGLDGGWVPSREQAGGMEGKVAVVATGAQPIGKQGRQRLTPRRYVATFGSSEQVGALAAAAAVRLGGLDAREQIVLGDGAPWIKTQAAWHFPDAVGILDWAHVARALHKAIRAARPGATHRTLRSQLHHALPDALWHGDLAATLTALQTLRPAPTVVPPAESPPALEDAISYLQGQRAWLGDYAAWQDAGYPVGSGLIERAVALVINRRMKRQGMRWRRDTASAVVALRVRELNATWDSDDGNLPTPRAA